MALLDEGFLETKLSLVEGRILYELAQADSSDRSYLRQQLGLDESYLTRLLRKLEADGLLVSSRSSEDARRITLRLTPDGRELFALIDRRSAQQTRKLLAGLGKDQQAQVVEAMGLILQALAPTPDRAVRLRPLQPGDLGWITQRHGRIYADEYGWNADFEALVATIVGRFGTDRDAEREHGWIAEVGGVRAGSVLCCRRDETTAQLRLLLVEPWARGLGVGGRLVDDCIRFARDAGYERLQLWTNDVLLSARRIYERAGFRLVDAHAHHSFGKPLTGQTWQLVLGD